MQDFAVENIGIRIVFKTSLIAFIGECIHGFNTNIRKKASYLFDRAFIGSGLRVRAVEHGYLFFPNKPDSRTSPFFDDTTVPFEYALNVGPRNGRADRTGKYGF